MAQTQVQFGPKMNDTTPPGVAAFPFLTRPYVSDKGPLFKCDLRFDPKDPDWAAFMERVTKWAETEVRDDLGNAYIKLPFVEEEENGEPTGMMLFRTRMPEKTIAGVTRKVAMYDPSLAPLEGDDRPSIGGGSRIALSVRIGSTKGSGQVINRSGEKVIYISAQPVACQILDLVEYGQHTPDAYGMKAAEGSYAAPVHTEEGAAAGDDEGDY